MKKKKSGCEIVEIAEAELERAEREEVSEDEVRRFGEALATNTVFRLGAEQDEFVEVATGELDWTRSEFTDAELARYSSAIERSGAFTVEALAREVREQQEESRPGPAGVAKDGD